MPYWHHPMPHWHHPMPHWQDRRHERVIKALVSDMPEAVAENLAGPLGGIKKQVDEIAADVALANRQISYVAEGGRQPGRPLAYPYSLFRALGTMGPALSVCCLSSLRLYCMGCTACQV